VADDVERSEKPTPKRRQEARREGQIAISQEIFTVANLLAVTVILLFLGARAVRHAGELFQRAWSMPDVVDPGFAADRLRETFGAASGVLLPILLTAAVAAVVAGVAQTKGNISFRRLRPRFSKLSPAKNLSRIVKHDAPIQLGKSLLKLAVVGGTIAFVVTNHIGEYSGLSRLPLFTVLGFEFGTLLRAWLAGCVAMIFIAAGDYAAEVWRTEKQLKMSRQEIKDEARQSEGDPQVRARIRSLQMEQARTRMMDQVAKADVVVTNPDHFSVALLYQREEMTAPKVVAKGRGFLALRIREIAEASGVAIVRNPPVARTLYRSVKVNQIIPEKLYQTVAELLAYVHRLDREKARAW
jgi:flagellar biosynthetic protein FlhB